MKECKLRIVTPDGVKFDGLAESVLVKCASGDVEIMAGHADYFASLATGRTRIIAGGKTMLASSSGGFLSVERGEVSIVAITLEFSDEIDLERAERAKELAEMDTVFYTGHCTGSVAYDIMKRIMQDKLNPIHSGDEVVLN